MKTKVKYQKFAICKFEITALMLPTQLIIGEAAVPPASYWPNFTGET
jgi:hypothetical protein